MATNTQAPPFDYITAQPYRSILERDFEEMQMCLQAGAWKAAMVMAGSLIEAILVEHLENLGSPGDEEALRKIMLNEAIKRCEALGELSETAAKLCSAVKDYRNLIHPGKVARDSLPPPDQNNAVIVTALVGKVTQEIAAKRNARAGFTAEQLLRKVECDAGAMALVPHILRDMREQEKARLLLEILPAAHAKHSAYDDEYWDATLPPRIAEAYRLTLNDSPQLAKAAAKQFYRLMLNGDSSEILRYGQAFFRAPEIQHLESSERAAVVDYLIENVLPFLSDDYSQVSGIGPFLTSQSFLNYVAPILRSALSARPSKAAQGHLNVELLHLSEDVKPSAKKHLLHLASLQEGRGNADNASALRDYAEWVDFPF